MKKIFLIISVICFYCFADSAFSVLKAQDQPFRIGLKFGFPQIAGLNLEYVTPLLQKKLSADLDVSYLPLNLTNKTLTYTNYAIGINYYFFHEGRGIYGGAGYDNMNVKATENVTNDGETASGTGSVDLNMLNLKIGGKHGGLFYFRWEVGYRIALSNEPFSVTANYSDGSSKSENVNFPIKSGILADIGFGFSF